MGDGGQAVQDSAVRLAGIGLAADIKAVIKSKFFAELLVKLFHLCVVIVKQFHKAGFRSCGAAAAEKFHGGENVIQFLQVGVKVLQPQRGPLAHRHQLGGLIVGIAQGGHGLIGSGEVGQVGHNAQQFLAQVPQSLTIEDQVRIIGYIAAGGTQVNDPGGRWGHLPIGIDVGHYIMPHFLFTPCRTVEVDVIHMGLQFGHLRSGDR